MACVEQLNCAKIIKSWHDSLRKSTIKYGYDEAWKKHLENHEKLQEYAEAMTKLAKYWNTNNTPNQCRISWIHNTCWKYFKDKDRDRIHKRELHFVKNVSDTADSHDLYDKIKVLDVGSCYNPLLCFDWMDVTAVDLCPSVPSVLKADFLVTDIGQQFITNENELQQFPEGYYHVVVFSLLLEYLPSKQQRLDACNKAYRLLKSTGLLIIITPDSNRAGANWKLMADWRNTLALMGFTRVYYEKLQHVHCMAYRKTPYPEMAREWAQFHSKPHFTGEILIPQDFNSKSREDSESEEEITCNNPQDVLETFLEMPQLNFEM